MSNSAVRIGPLETALREKITEALKPSRLEVFNDSSKHSHHRAMAGNTSTETHFRLEVVSAAFEQKSRLARHKLVYGLLREEIDAADGIHALQLSLQTPAEAGESMSARNSSATANSSLGSAAKRDSDPETSHIA